MTEFAQPAGSDPQGDDSSLDGLTRRDRDILAFERQWWKYAGAKEQAIRELFDMSATRYYQVLNALIDTPAALAPTRCWSSDCADCGRVVSGNGQRGGSGSKYDLASMVHLAPHSPVAATSSTHSRVLLAALGVVVLVIAIIALRQPNGHQAALRTSASPRVRRSLDDHQRPHRPPSSAVRRRRLVERRPRPPRPPRRPPTGLKSVPLVVLNNTSKTGLAETAAGRFKAGGWTVTNTGNLVNNIISTCAYYDPSVPNAQAAATALQAQFPAIKRVVAEVRRPAGRADRRRAHHRLQLPRSPRHTRPSQPRP